MPRSSREFRSGVRQATRAARPGAALFLFTFSRDTLPAAASPVPGETFVFTQFSGEPQCFLTAEQIVDELGSAGFVPDPANGLIPPKIPNVGGSNECAFWRLNLTAT